MRTARFGPAALASATPHTLACVRQMARALRLLGAAALVAGALAAAADVKAQSGGDAADKGWLASHIPAAFGSASALLNSITMIIATELGDKTFCIAAVMAMRYNRVFVFGGAIGALIVMTVLSVLIGVAVPTLLSRTYTHYAAAVLFAYFGFKLLKEAREMTGSGDHDELRETEQELGIATPNEGEGKGSTGAAAPSGGDGKASSSPVEDISGSASSPGSGAGSSAADVEAGRLLTDADPSGKQAGMKTRRDTAQGVGGLPLLLHYCKKDWGILTQAFTLTFLAEWGDRSQIATIAMAAAQDPVGITAGAVIGHSLCTGLAVLGGRMLAARISEKTVATGGGALFMLFAAHSFWVGPEQV